MIKKINYYVSAIMITISSVYILIALSDTRPLEELTYLFIILAILLFSGFTLYKPSGIKSTIAVTSIILLLMFFIVVVAKQIGIYSLVPIVILTQILISIVMRQRER